MLFVAVSLLPLVSVLLLVMDRIEDRILDPAPLRGRHAGQRRHLRLIPGGRRGAGDGEDLGDSGNSGDSRDPMDAGEAEADCGDAGQERRAA
ncbi:hypothetical protein [Streptomyces anandii]|uniref:hypothetical protein n=1 Tax=Streptomyces anandii TaxID=285454 RepID=UPI00167865D6|nr:hypothetical protein [Streptomyces anandii]GGX96235.1 hypothetical protein GCM10010510_46910 [Streptomyces anandii JCM 4720]